MQVSPKEGKVIVENANMVPEARKAPQNGRGRRHHQGRRRHLCLQSAGWFAPRCGKPTRVGHKILKDGTKERICKKCGESL